MTHRSIIRLFASVLLAGAIVACGDNVPDTAPSTGLLTVDPPFAGVDEGTTQDLTATLNGVAVPVTWETSDAAIATVSPDGVVTGVSPGNVSVTAKVTGDPTQMRSASISVLPVLGIGLTSGVAVTGVTSGNLAQNKGLIYHISVPAGATSLTVSFTGGTGDGDIYVQKGSPSDNPDNFGAEDPGCHSWNAGNTESCTVDNPAKGTWYIFVAVWDPYAGATLKATVTP